MTTITHPDGYLITKDTNGLVCHQFLSAKCLDCDKLDSVSINSHPNAKRHARLNPNHRVIFEWHFHYNPRDKDI
jgi:hypothetical protein